VVAAQPDWRAIHDELAAREPASLSARELDRLGESLFWLDRPEESVAVLGRAFTGHVAVGDHERAARTAWQLFYDHALVGETALANGWLERARRSAGLAEGAVAPGFLAVAESDLAAWAGALDEAVAQAERALEHGRTAGNPDLMAMALQARGRALVACGRVEEGVASLDEAMVAVINGELTPLFTGWVYCNALSTCHDLADLSRAVQWSDAALRWCAEVQDGRLYPGICRLHAVELASLQGSWQAAAALARQACDDLTSHDPRYSGDAHYLVGELRRMVGDLDLAEDSFTLAHQLGRVPQPGLGLVRLAQGRVDAAIKGLRLGLDSPSGAPMRHAQLLAALVEAHLDVEDVASADGAAAELADVARRAASAYLRSLAHMAQARVLLARGDALAAYRVVGDALEIFHALGLRYDEARAREVRGRAAELLDERDSAQLDLSAAHEAFVALGADPDARRLAAQLGHPPSALSSRELDVLRLVARGSTNKDVAAALFISEHTVARHLSNIYTKLGVGSRSAATACAYEQSLI
jgi:ATP/maltotriose-dependent transcriptional regulator MalT